MQHSCCEVCKRMHVPMFSIMLHVEGTITIVEFESCLCGTSTQTCRMCFGNSWAHLSWEASAGDRAVLSLAQPSAA